MAVTSAWFYLVDVQRQDESLADRRGELLVGLDEVVRFLGHVVEVEHVVQVAVIVGDDVEHDVVVVFVGVDVMENHQSIGSVAKRFNLSCLYVDDVKERLKRGSYLSKTL